MKTMTKVDAKDVVVGDVLRYGTGMAGRVLVKTTLRDEVLVVLQDFVLPMLLVGDVEVYR